MNSSLLFCIIFIIVRLMYHDVKNNSKLVPIEVLAFNSLSF